MKKLVLPALLIAAFCACLFSSRAETLGPARTLEDFTALMDSSSDGDILLLQGKIFTSGQTFSPEANITLASASSRYAILEGLSLTDAKLTLRHVRLDGPLTVSGESEIILQDNVRISGSSGTSAISFDGTGLLISEPGCLITGGSGAPGVIIRHRGGDFYAGLEGTILGGDGSIGGVGVVVSPLLSGGTLFFGGSIRGGAGVSAGGNAVNLYDLEEDAFISISGTLIGGDGAVGGDGVQIVSASGHTFVDVDGVLIGGDGIHYGGNALTLMSAAGSSSVSIAGTLTGGSIQSEEGEPGQSILVADRASLSHAVVGNCILQDGVRGRRETVPLFPEITSSIDSIEEFAETPSPKP